MNKHIELVKKWQGEEVSVEALQANADAAWAAWADADDDAYAAEPAYVAARAARAAAARAAAYDAYADYWADNVDYWVKRYEELTNGK